MIYFNPSKGPTIGVELELQIIHRDTMCLENIAPDILSSMDEKYKLKIKEEFIMSMVEINTGICNTVKEVEDDLKDSLEYLDTLLHERNATFFSASLHPFSKCTEQKVTDNVRYLSIMDDLQLVGRRFITQGLHVHIGVKNAEEAIRVTNEMRIYLPHLLAISTSSPFYEGENTGLMSYRTKLFEALPKTGIPDYLREWKIFCQLVDLLQKAGYIKSVKDIWWDVRPHPEFGTVETRVCDIPCRFSHILGIVALIQALVSYLTKHPGTGTVHMQLLRSNKWQAARYGLNGVFANPLTGHIKPLKEAIMDLLNLVEKESTALGSIRYLHNVEEILRRGTGAHRQLSLYAEKADFRRMIRILKKEFFL